MTQARYRMTCSSLFHSTAKEIKYIRLRSTQDNQSHESHSEAAAQDRTRTLLIQDSPGNRPVSVRLHVRQRNEKCHFHSADA